MNYLTLKENIFNISQNMFPQICVDMDRFENKQYNYYFALANEIYRGLALCCVAIDIQSYSQIGTLLRQLLEQVATAKIIGLNENNLSAYGMFAKARHYYLEHNEDDCELKKLYDASQLTKKQRKNMIDFYSLGWLELIGVTEISYDKLFELANIHDLAIWRKYCNNFVHTNLTYMELTQEGMIKLNTEFIYLLAILFDEICCSYHNVAGFDFKFGNIDLFSEFRKTYAKITEIRKEIKDGPLQ